MKRDPNKIRRQLYNAEKGKYLPLIKEQLQLINCKVKMWLPYEPSQTFYAYFDTRSVIIPVPVCDYSFLVALHEIGHISEGERQYSYLQEYRADMWATKRAKKLLDSDSAEYVNESISYVLEHLICNIASQGLKIANIKPYVLEWLKHTPETLELLLGDHAFVKGCVTRINRL